MAGSLRSFAGRASRVLLHPEGPAALQQRRYAGDLPVKSNAHIENWASYRENVEQTFKFNAKSLTSLAIFGFALPIWIYSKIVSEYDMADKTAGRKKKDFM